MECIDASFLLCVCAYSEQILKWTFVTDKHVQTCQQRGYKWTVSNPILFKNSNYRCTTDTHTNWTVQVWIARKLSKWKYKEVNRSNYEVLLDSKGCRYLYKSWSDNLKLPKFFIHVSLRKQWILAAKSINLRAVLLLGRTDSDCWIWHSLYSSDGTTVIRSQQFCGNGPVSSPKQSWFHSRITWSMKISNNLSANNLFGEM